MTPSELKYHVERNSEESHYFTRSTMKFWGDTMRNYGVRSAVVLSNYDADGNYVEGGGVSVEVWELYRKRPVKHGVRTSAYFAKDDYRRVFVA